MSRLFLARPGGNVTNTIFEALNIAEKQTRVERETHGKPLKIKMEIPVNTGLSYEVLVRQIFQDIVNDTGGERTVDVQHSVTLHGVTSTHQIDVYWEFEHAGITHKVIVQVKDWNKPVDQGELLKFKGVLDDLPGQPRGVVVTRKGYQSGAAEFAKAHGVQLFELTEWGPTSGRYNNNPRVCAYGDPRGNLRPVEGEVQRLVLRCTLACTPISCQS